MLTTKLNEETGHAIGGSGVDEAMKLGEETGRGAGAERLRNLVKRLDME